MNNKKITVELFSIIKDLIKNAWIIVLAVLIGYMGIYIVSHSIYKPEYTASATLVVNNRGRVDFAVSGCERNGRGFLQSFHRTDHKA